MSDLLNSASLVMVPSGYKEDTVYSVVPSDGSGDLAFTRASNGTRINSAGLVEVCPWNWNTNSEDFTSNWGTDGTSTATNNFATAPNGTTTAAKVVANSANGYAYKSIPVAPNTYTLSYYVKASANTTMSIGLNDIGGSGFNPKYNIPVTTEWQRIEHSASVTLGSNLYIDFGSLQTGKDYFLWGAQLNIGATAKPYFPTTDRLNVPRLTYQNGGGGCPSLLLEKQSTNLLTYSEQFDNAAWSKSNVTITANNTTSPDGTQNADLATATSGGELLQGLVLNTSTSYTFSFYVKKGTATDAKYRVYNFDAGVNVVSPISYISQTNTSTWVRVSVSFTSSATGVNYGIYLLDSASAGTMYFWGAQMEASSYVTSYIVSTSSSATRVADACSKTGISSLIGQTEGVFYAEFTMPETQSPSFFSISDGTSANRIIFGCYLGNLRYYTNSSSGGFSAIGVIDSSPVVGQVYKIAIAYKSNDFVVYKNGTNTNTLTTYTVPTSLTQMDNAGGGASQNIYASVKEILLFPTRLTNAELASLTTI